MKRFLSTRVSALVLILFAGTAQAGTLDGGDVAWSYNWTPGAPAVTADDNAAAGITFTNEPKGDAVNSSDIVATNLRVFSAALGASPDILTAGGAYSLTLGLSVVDAGMPYSGSLTFHGSLNGSFSKENSNIANIFSPDFQQELTLGSYTFNVTLTSYTPPGPPNQSNAGSISAHVDVSSASANQLPEPSTILLSCLGGLSCLGAAWRRKNRTRARA